jgi:prevent-host-death family protein
MTRIRKESPVKATRRRLARERAEGRWLLHDAKARFSELIRRVRAEGPQRVTIRGRDEVIVISAEEFQRLRSDVTGEALIAILQASPHRDVEIQPKRAAMAVREVEL